MRLFGAAPLVCGLYVIGACAAGEAIPDPSDWGQAGGGSRASGGGEGAGSPKGGSSSLGGHAASTPSQGGSLAGRGGATAAGGSIGNSASGGGGGAGGAQGKGGAVASGGGGAQGGAGAAVGLGRAGAAGAVPFGSGGALGKGGGVVIAPGVGGALGRGGAVVIAPGVGGAGAGTTTPTGDGTGSGATPVLPAISGTCPTFATGTVSVGGLGGIALQVGAKKSGTGSLLFYWHGTGSSTAEVTRMLPAAVRSEILGQGGIIVAFQGSLGTGGDCSGTATFSKDDFKVADLIAACAVRDHDIDPRRIYTTGCSAGGLQAGCMGELRSSYVAATVPNSGGIVMAQTIQDKSHVPAVMTMHGGSSDVVIVAFSQTSATYDQQMKAAGSFVVNCNHGGGHCGAPAALYSAGWEFMKAHPFGVEPEPYSSGLPSNFPTTCKVY